MHEADRAMPQAQVRDAAIATAADEPTPGTGDRRIERAIGAVLLFLLAIGCFVVLRPFLPAVIWAAILSSSTWPIYARVERLLHGRRTVAALLMTVLAALLFLLPLAALGSRLAGEVMQIAGIVSRWMAEGPSAPPGWVATVPVIGGALTSYWQTIADDGAKLTADLQPYVGPARQWLLDIAASLAAGIGELALSLLISFFLYRNGMASVHALSAMLGRIAGKHGEHLMAIAGSTIKGVVYGIVGTNFIQAALAMLGLLIAGVPGALFLGFATFFLTLVPLAPAIVFVPAILWLAQQDATMSAIFLGIWYVVVFMILESVLRAYFISRGGDLPLLLVFLGIFGGVLAFGLLGIFVGPTLLALGYALVRDWSDIRRAPEMAGQARPWQ